MRPFAILPQSAVKRSGDRVGALIVPTRVIDWQIITNNRNNGDLVGSVVIPPGTKMVEVVALGGGGNSDYTYTGGGGGGSVEYRFAPSSEGLAISYKINRAAAYSGNNPRPDVTVTLPSDLGLILASGGESSTSANGASGGSGSGPAGSIVRVGGAATSSTSYPGQGPFGGGASNLSGGGGAGPYGGSTSRPGSSDGENGAGAPINQSASSSGLLSLKFYGEPL